MTHAPSLPEILDREWPLFIGGQPVPAESGRAFADESPVTEEVIAAVPDGGEADVAAAVAAARPAAAAWRKVPARERGALVAHLATILEEHARELALLDAIDGGHPGQPPEAAPLSALRIGELFGQSLPPGLLSVVTGDGPACGRAIARHPAIRRIGFIGSDTTGRSIQRDAAETGVKDVSLELGGKNALIAFPDADPDQVAPARWRA